MSSEYYPLFSLELRNVLAPFPLYRETWLVGHFSLLSLRAALMSASSPLIIDSIWLNEQE